MSNNHTLARPYAEAAFEYAREQHAFDVWSTQLQWLAEIIKDKQINALLSDPRVGEEMVANALLEVSQNFFNDHIKNFIKIIASHQRLHALPEIITLYEAYRAQHEKMIHVQITSAFALPESEQKSLQRALEIRLQRNVIIKTKEDKSLIGGAIVQAGDLVIDGSVRGKLARMAQELMV